MRNRIILLLVCALLLFISCSKDGDSGSSTTGFNESLLFNKWWYSTSGASEIYISSDGSFEYNLSESLSDSGTWEWINTSHTRMKFTVTPGGSNIINDFWAEYTEIESSTMKFKFSDDNNDYSSTYSFTDSE